MSCCKSRSGQIRLRFLPAVLCMFRHSRYTRKQETSDTTRTLSSIRYRPCRSPLTTSGLYTGVWGGLMRLEEAPSVNLPELNPGTMHFELASASSCPPSTSGR